MVAVLGDHGGLCGGTLINDRYILTAAHCVLDGIEDLHVVFGAHGEEDPFKGVRAVNHTVHTLYNTFTTSQGDIKLAQPVSIIPICLGRPKIAAHNNPDNLFATGWGLTAPNSDNFGKQLDEVSLAPMPDKVCVNIWDSNIQSDKQICAGEKEKGTCNGDSGGPLSTRVDGKVFQVGVVSYGSTECGVNTGAPRVFSRVPYYLNWI